MSFAHPWFFLLVPVVIAAAIWVRRSAVRKRSRLIYPADSWLKQRPRTSRLTPFKIFFWLRLFALISIIFALARPQEMFKREQRFADSIDVILSLDLSRSMDAIDFTPNRITVALNTLVEFVDQRPDDRIGLVLFSGDAYLAVPVTHDHALLKDAILNARNDQLLDGTAIGQSIAVAVNHLKNSRAKSRVIVLATDGDNNMGSVDPLTATELARAHGIRMYTIGIGKKGRVPYPVKTRDAFGREVEVYQYLTDAANVEQLSLMAERTGGRFFNAEDENILSEVFRTISSLERTKVEVQSSVRFGELAWPWLWAALLLVFLEGLALNTRWRKFP